MSRIGKKLIEIPQGVKVETTDKEIKVSGPKGELKQAIHHEIKVELKDNKIFVSPKAVLSKRGRGLWGLYRALISNMVEGVSKGFEKKLELVGVGYRAKQNGVDGVTITAGFSHPVEFKAPKGVEILVPEQTIIIIRGADKDAVGKAVVETRLLKPPPEPASANLRSPWGPSVSSTP
jgi:large subunit ribosomal protein L6